MNILQTETEPIQGISFENGVLKCYGNVYIAEEKLKDLFSILYDYFLPSKKDMINTIKNELKNNNFSFDINYSVNGTHKKEYEIQLDQGLIRLELMLYFKNNSTPNTDDTSYIIELTSVKSFEFYDCFGKRQYPEITLDEIHELIEDNINRIVY